MKRAGAVPSRMGERDIFLMKGSRAVRWALALVVVGVLVAGLRAQERRRETPRRVRPGPASYPELERFRALSPEERRKDAEKHEAMFVRVNRADLLPRVVERGAVEAADALDVVCRVPATPGSTVASTIAWLVADGTHVKKGNRLVLLDDSGFREQLREQGIALAKAAAARVAAETQLALVRKEIQLERRVAELELKRAQLRLKKYTGKDAEEKEILELEIEKAKLAQEVLALRGEARIALAQAEVKTRAVALQQEAGRKQVLEKQIEACVLTAPRDGVAVYYVPERSRFAPEPSLLAQGEAVREGQILLRVCGLERFNVTTRVPEAQISRVRIGQPVSVRIDAFPARVLNGRVKEVARMASVQDWLSRDVKVYPVVVELTGRLPELKPGMSAEVRIEGERRAKVLQLPREALLPGGRGPLCYVKVGKGLEERWVATGARNETYVEITEGLKEGEVVLVLPRLLAQPPRSSGIPAPSGSPTPRKGR